MNRIVAIRGATTISNNTVEDIKNGTLELIREILDKNQLFTAQGFVSLIITSTADIDACYPASSITESEMLKNVPLFSALEPPIKNSLPLCIRMMLTIACDENFEPKHVYINQAAGLKTNTKK